jgi:hypothetical protein
MDTVTRFEPRRVDQAETGNTMQPDPKQRLAVTATYLLSEEGRKASLLAGGNGRALQEVTIQVPANRLHLVTVDANGRAHLKLRPRFELNSEQRVVKIDALAAYDVPPTVDDLFRDAGRNHQLEHAFHAERSAARRAQREADQQRREEVAGSFLADATQRAMRRPSPSPQRCFVDTPDGRLLFDVRQDHGSARLVPPEAFRRWRADLRAREEWRQRETAAQIASHAHKKQVVADWVAQYGTPQYATAVITPTNVTIFNTDAVKATDAQWGLVQELQQVFPDATVVLREHRISWKADVNAPSLTMYGVIVTRKVGPFDLRREYAAPDS